MLLIISFGTSRWQERYISLCFSRTSKPVSDDEASIAKKKQDTQKVNLGESPTLTWPWFAAPNAVTSVSFYGRARGKTSVAAARFSHYLRFRDCFAMISWHRRPRYLRVSEFFFLRSASRLSSSKNAGKPANVEWDPNEVTPQTRPEKKLLSVFYFIPSQQFYIAVVF